MENKNTNPLGTEKIRSLLMKFAIPSIIAMLVSSLYNIVDQFFIGRSVGMLGNAATNVAFPLTITCTALALCKFCSNGTPILKLAVHSFWFSGTRFLLKTVRFSFIIVM